MVDVVDYQAVLTDLKMRRARLDQLIAGIEETVMGQGDGSAPVPAVDTPGLNGAPVSVAIHGDTFFNMSIIDAAKKFLKMARRAQPSKTIADALERGGLKRPADNVLSGVLVRAAKGREIVKVGRGMWGLAEFYPRGPKEPEERSRPRKRPAAKKARAAASVAKSTKKSTKRVASNAAPPASSDSTGKVAHKDGVGSLETVLDVLRTAGRPMHADEIVERSRKLGVQASRLPIEGFLGRQVKAGAVQKLGPRVYQIAG